MVCLTVALAFEYSFYPKGNVCGDDVSKPKFEEEFPSYFLGIQFNIFEHEKDFE
jgi:hypothetical protein